jgi:hypothetical protein
MIQTCHLALNKPKEKRKGKEKNGEPKRNFTT